MVNNMIPTAQQARDMMPTEISRLKELITEAAQNGYEYVIIQGTLQDYTVELLTSIGYQIDLQQNDLRTEHITTISWEQ